MTQKEFFRIKMSSAPFDFKKVAGMKKPANIELLIEFAESLHKKTCEVKKDEVIIYTSSNVYYFTLYDKAIVRTKESRSGVITRNMYTL